MQGPHDSGLNVYNNQIWQFGCWVECRMSGKLDFCLDSADIKAGCGFLVWLQLPLCGSPGWFGQCGWYSLNCYDFVNRLFCLVVQQQLLHGLLLHLTEGKKGVSTNQYHTLMQNAGPNICQMCMVIDFDGFQKQRNWELVVLKNLPSMIMSMRYARLCEWLARFLVGSCNTSRCNVHVPVWMPAVYWLPCTVSPSAGPHPAWCQSG